MKHRKGGRYSLTVALVVFVFIILIATNSLLGIVYLYLFRVGALNLYSTHWFPLPVLGLLLASIAVATSLAALSGGGPLRPFRKLTKATEEIASGNFDIRVPEEGPREMRRLAQSFNKMAEELGGIETLRTDFVNNVSHEFKTPVVSIKGFAKLLRKENLSEESRREYLDIIIRESERLSKLSGNVLLLSKIENENIASEQSTFALDEQIRRCILLLETEWTQKQIDMDVSLPATAYTGNEELLQQVWLNLIGNAIKFTGPQGIITVSLASSDRCVMVMVSDTGVGMDEETRRHLFDKFFQGDRSHATEGNGLGLALVQRIVELSGGTVNVQSAPGEGSTFTVELPLRAREDT